MVYIFCMARAVLSEEERGFLGSVTRAVFANPFGEERVRADAEISGVPAEASAERRLRLAVERVRAFLADLETAGRADVGAYEPPDRSVLARAHLFDVFHHHMDRFDALIRDQIRAGEESCPVPFAPEAIDMLASRGFRRQDAVRYFGLFYQLRRAYFFIDLALV